MKQEAGEEGRQMAERRQREGAGKRLKQRLKQRQRLRQRQSKGGQ